jgi:hypothetical protein
MCSLADATREVLFVPAAVNSCPDLIQQTDSPCGMTVQHLRTAAIIPSFGLRRHLREITDILAKRSEAMVIDFELDVLEIYLE